MRPVTKSEADRDTNMVTTSTHSRNKVFLKTLNIGSKNKIDPLKFYVLSSDNDDISNHDMEMTVVEKEPLILFQAVTPTAFPQTPALKTSNLTASQTKKMTEISNLRNDCENDKKSEVPKNVKVPLNSNLATTLVASQTPDVDNTSSDIIIGK